MRPRVNENLTVGRMVWYRDDEWEAGACSPAIVTWVYVQPLRMVDLVVFYRAFGPQPVAEVRQGPANHQWRWPWREEYQT